ncbi:hypothetical protein [Nitrosopumilus piranensis]|uniref:Uncharacterized protein n=1 Tax=Nitrosopumilus piranensis TaxID=1582439 RepID=A0A0C5CD28_9ARCH|nr:hypothetical protein [Nitrosopumilus piranensis]AJM93097.1 exported protein of unknown function [Nitrosopumilus piranensis]
MNTRYKITIIILLIIGIPVSSIITIDYVYANTDTPQFAVISKVFCPYFPIPDDFVANQIFFAVYYTDPIKQLDMIHYNFYSVCYKETEDPPIDLDPEYDPSNSKGCPQFCPKEPTLLSELQFEEIKFNIEKTQYDICDVRLQDNKIILDLHKFFEGSDPEKKIISQIPSSVNYEIVYHEGYSDYFIGTETAHGCEGLNEN